MLRQLVCAFGLLATATLHAQHAGERAAVETERHLEVSTFDHDGRQVRKRPRLYHHWSGRVDLDHPLFQVRRIEDGTLRSVELTRDNFIGDRWVIPVEPGDYLVAWRQSGIPIVERTVHVRPEDERVRLRLQLEGPSANAWLKVEVRDPDDVPLDTDKQIYLLSPSGWVAASTVENTGHGRAAYRAPRWSVRIPPGRYQVLAEVEPSWMCIMPSPMPVAQHLPVTREIQLQPGERRTVVLRLGAAGHLTLVVKTRLRPAPSFDDVLGVVPGSVFSKSRLGPNYDGGGLRLVSHPDGEVVRPEMTAHALPSPDGRNPSGGWSARSRSPVPVGRYRLEIDSPDGEPFVREVEIRAGKVTNVVW